jgi:hypothetical protein
VPARGVGCLLGERGEPLHGRHGVRRESGSVSGRRSASARPELGKLLAELRDQRARLVGTLALVGDRAHQAVQLRVGLGEVSGEHAVLLDPLARDRLELGA